MNNDINILVTLSDQVQLLRVALKLNTQMLNPEEVDAALEPENKAKIRKFLPDHCASFGDIVEVREIFEIKDWTEKLVA